MTEQVGTVNGYLGWWSWRGVSSPGKQTTLMDSWDTCKPHTTAPPPVLLQAPSTVGRMPRNEWHSQPSWTCAPRVFLASALPFAATDIFREPAGCTPGAQWSLQGLGHCCCPDPGAHDPAPLSMAESAPAGEERTSSPPPRRAHAAGARCVSHRTCDLGQVMFWTWIVGGEASAAQGTPAQIVTKVLRRPGRGGTDST